MTIGTIDESQRKAATVVGFAYLFALPPAVFAEFYVRARLIAVDNAAQTAQNIMAHERLFRLGIASNLTVFAVDVALIMAMPSMGTRCRLWRGCRSVRITMCTTSAWCSLGFEALPSVTCGLSPASSQEH
jgi:hypothetical protein